MSDWTEAPEAESQEEAPPESPRPRYRVPDDMQQPLRDPAGGIHWPGEEFDADYEPALEARLIRRGQIVKQHDQSEEG